MGTYGNKANCEASLEKKKISEQKKNKTINAATTKTKILIFFKINDNLKSQILTMAIEQTFNGFFEDHKI